MSQTPFSSPSVSSSNFQYIFDSALNQYKKKTKNDLLAHQLTTQLENCNSPGAILEVLDEQYHVQQFIRSRSGDEGSKQWLNTTANVLCAFSNAIGEGVGLVFSPGKVIFAGVGVLLSAARDVGASQDALVDLFERIENFFRRLETYTEVPPTHAMMDLIVKIMVEVLGLLAIATKEIKQRSAKKYLKKLLGRTDIEDALKRLDKLTHDEALMATAQVLKLAHKVDDKVTGIGDKVNAVIHDGNEARLINRQTATNVDAIESNQLRQDIRRWLSPSDPSTNYNIACDARHKGSAEWFFQGSIFNEWKSAGSLLWVHGKPGSGKSILCSTIIKDVIALHDTGLASVAYFYFDFRDTSKQNRRDLLLSLLTQLSARSDPYCDILSRLYLEHDSGARQPSEDDLIKCLHQMLILPDQHPVYLILDAIDECPDTFGMPSPREQVLHLLKGLVELSLPNLHLCITSRPEIDIRTVLEPLTLCRVSLHDQTGQKNDIIDYITSVVHSDSKMRKWRDEDKRLVIETLSERADGMFRWVFCQLEALRYCFPQSVRHILEELPGTLDETYERILRDINKANRDHAHRLLQCLTVAVRPLHIAELAEVLAVDFGMATSGGTSKLNMDWRWEDQQEAVLSTCSSLIVVVNEYGSQVIQFSHFSVKEFLTSQRLAGSSEDVSRFHIQLKAAHTILAKACLGVLLRLDNEDDNPSVESKFPLAGYAAEHWVDHAQFEEVPSLIREGMECLFHPDKSHFSAWLRVHDIDTGPDASSAFYHFTPSSKTDGTPLYYAALCGFHDLAEYLIINHQQDVNAVGGFLLSPLVAALGMGHFNVAQLLYQHGADILVKGLWKRTLLQALSIGGKAEIIQWLLDHDADPNIREDEDWTSLHVAAYNGRIEVVRILLQNNADISLRDDEGRIPLHRASERGHSNIVRLFLERGVDANACDKHGSTPLHVASSGGGLLLVSSERRLEVARLLVEYGVNVDAVDDQGRTPLQVASGRDIEKFLSGHGSTTVPTDRM